MAKKADLLEAATKLGLTVTNKNTIAEIEAALKGADTVADAPSSDRAEATSETPVEEVKLA
ncbi:MAG: hypothetical protein ABI716_03570, partial [Candidatus Saccharibacteria bacterium]